MSKAVYPKGAMIFNPNAKAPKFVKGTLVISLEKFNNWLQENHEYVSDYKGEGQIKLNILEGDNGLYLTVDTYKKPDNAEAGWKPTEEDYDNNPF